MGSVSQLGVAGRSPVKILTSIVTSSTDPSSSVTLATAVLPEDPDFFDGDSDIVLGGAADVGDFFVSAGMLWAVFFLLLLRLLLHSAIGRSQSVRTFLQKEQELTHFNYRPPYLNPIEAIN